MIIAHLIGGNEIEGIRNGQVFVNRKELPNSYEELVAICGNIPLEELDTSYTLRRTAEHIARDYAEMVSEVNEELGIDFVKENFLTNEVVYSKYEIDTKNQTLILHIDACN